MVPSVRSGTGEKLLTSVYAAAYKIYKHQQVVTLAVFD